MHNKSVTVNCNAFVNLPTHEQSDVALDRVLLELNGLRSCIHCEGEATVTGDENVVAIELEVSDATGVRGGLRRGWRQNRVRRAIVGDEAFLIGSRAALRVVHVRGFAAILVEK